MKSNRVSVRRGLVTFSALALFACQTAPITDGPRKPASVSDEGKKAMEAVAFGGLDKIHTDALLVYKDGKLLYSRYDRGYDETKKHLSWSMGKSISALVAARAVNEGKLGYGDALSKWVPQYKGTATLLDVFQMSSGLSFKEEYAGIPVDSDATKMLYLDGIDVGMAPYTATRKMRPEKPGEYFYYSSGDANLIQEAVKNAIGDQKTYDAYPWTAFFDKLDIKATFEQDVTGTFVGSSYIYMTAPEYARIGQLVANRGVWNKEQIIPTDYFEKLNEVAPGVMKNALSGTSQTRAYSMQTTTNRPITGRHIGSEYPDLPVDSILMIGHQGQLVIASPSQNLVIVRLATDHGDPFNPHRQELFAAIKKFVTEDNGLPLETAGTQKESDDAIKAAALPKKGAKLWDYFKVPHLIRALYAKEMCSCLYVEKRTNDECKEDLKQSLPILGIGIPNEKKGTFKAFLGLNGSKAKFHGDRLGCTLEK
ncbi:MAG: serine hydrolase [Bdellovibrionales bacterium]|nr:serine hydrolase [Bdellovibrionales bacterium]